MTIKSKATIDKMIQNNGILEDTQFCSIWQYKNQNGNILYSAFLTTDNDMWDSPYVYDPILLWPK